MCCRRLPLWIASMVSGEEPLRHSDTFELHLTREHKISCSGAKPPAAPMSEHRAGDPGIASHRRRADFYTVQISPSPSSLMTSFPPGMPQARAALDTTSAGCEAPGDEEFVSLALDRKDLSIPPELSHSQKSILANSSDQPQPRLALFIAWKARHRQVTIISK